MGDIDIGARLRQARISSNMTQKKACQELGIPKVQTLSAYERGVNDLSACVLKKMAELYNVSVDWVLFGGDGRPEARKSATEHFVELLEASDALGLRISESPHSTVTCERFCICTKGGNSHTVTMLNELLGEIYKLHNLSDVLCNDYYKILIDSIVERYRPQLDEAFME